MKEPKQRRSQETLLRLRIAGMRLINQSGPDGLTVQDVAKQARSSVGSFYQRFEGKDEFLVDLWIHENSTAAEEWERRVAATQVDSPDLICRLADLIREAEAEQGAALRHLRDYLRRGNLLPDVPTFADRLAELVRGAVQTRAEMQGVAQPEKVARIIAAGLFQMVESSTEGRAPYAALLAPVECSDLEALLHPGARPEPRTGAAVDPFDVWDDGADAEDHPGSLGAGA